MLLHHFHVRLQLVQSDSPLELLVAMVVALGLAGSVPRQFRIAASQSVVGAITYVHEERRD